MRLLALLAVAVLLTVVQAKAQVYEPYDGYDEYGGYDYDDPYSPYPPPPYYDPAPRYQEPLYDRRGPSTRSARGNIVIATREHTLIYTTASGEQFAYPIAVGREGKQWYGSTRVVSKRMHPEWRPTASMRQKNPRLPAVVKAGPANPLGTRAIYLADGLLRIHGTNDPSSIGTNASSGCFRMYREDVEELYDMVQPGTRVIVQR
ncbi:L,D-transpeptidase domain-containing protein [Rhizobium phaseoli]|uniref:Hypothetical conserved protein n=1 Tax=Rhizobium etli (strain CIAT 652) TaxID=491916 RepID=B3PVX3_RHIE6|nr:MULTISPECIES: L,D-transpeptidase [Rhizobium]ACE90625.1 hypothetical conserved protein [Rhizobium etli CIAT 652]ANL71619.1 L,D-transpeptidase domain-containing protein [Rhizobium phaseoli]ULR46487.1 L,D-transpeptidase [Rhizobium sp. K102]